MTEIVVITHGCLAKEFVSIAESIVDRVTNVIPVCFDLNLDPAEYNRKIMNVMESIHPEHSVIILTDLFGGTPSNISIPFVKKGKVEVITGLNLPMLMYLLNQPEDVDFQELCSNVKRVGQEAIIIAGEFLT